MPPSIDPVKNMFSTGSGLIARVMITFVAGWIGNSLSRLCASFTSWEDFKYPLEIISEVFDIFEPTTLLSIVLWPLMIIHYLSVAPFYALILSIIAIVCVYKIVRTDDPILFWSVFLVAALTPGMALAAGTAVTIVPLLIVFTGLGAALWYAISLDFPEWIDWFREKTGM